MHEDWIAAVKAELGLDIDVNEDLILDLARDAARGVARPAAPLTTFLAGVAVGRAGGDADDVEVAVGRLQQLALGWAAETP